MGYKTNPNWEDKLLSHLPAEGEIKRWNYQRKAAIIIMILRGKMTVREAEERWHVALPELEEWIAKYQEFGPEGLKAQKKYNYRDKK